MIVAGGGGGAGATTSSTANTKTIGGAGGGTSGQKGQYNPVISTSYSNADGNGGTQTAGGTAATYSDERQTIAPTAGSFGVGGTGNLATSWSGASGGGGWYGGGGANYTGGGGGGSGYVYTSSNASSYPSGCLLNSSYYLTSASTVAGNISFVQPNGTAAVGKTGNGYARITYLGS